MVIRLRTMDFLKTQSGPFCSNKIYHVKEDEIQPADQTLKYENEVEGHEHIRYFPARIFVVLWQNVNNQHPKTSISVIETWLNL